MTVIGVVGSGFRVRPNGEGVTCRNVGVVDIHAVVARRDVQEQESAVRRGRGRGHEPAAHRGQVHVDTADPDLARILQAVVIGIAPNAIADDCGARECGVAEVVCEKDVVSGDGVRRSLAVVVPRRGREARRDARRNEHVVGAARRGIDSGEEVAPVAVGERTLSTNTSSPFPGTPSGSRYKSTRTPESPISPTSWTPSPSTSSHTRSPMIEPGATGSSRVA